MYKSIITIGLIVLSQFACEEVFLDPSSEEIPSSFEKGMRISLDEVGPGDLFGSALGSTDRFLAIGAYKDDDLGQDAGIVYVLNRSGIDFESKTKKVMASDGKQDDEFGYALAIEGNTLIIGSPKQDIYGENSGAVYVFQYQGNNWEQIQKLSPKDSDSQERFGWSVDLSGRYVIIGQYQDRESWDPHSLTKGNAQGAVYIFDTQSWEQVAKLSPPTGMGARFDGFGQAVAISGDWAIIGAKGNSGPQYNEPGNVYVFRRMGDDWQFEAQLHPKDRVDNDFFGADLDIDGNKIAVAAPRAFNTLVPSLNKGNGHAFVFSFNGSHWVEEEKLFGRDTQVDDEFGASVSIHKNQIIVGAPQATIKTPSNGAAYLVSSTENGWKEVQKLVAPDPLNEDLFGTAITIADDAIFVGASRRCNQKGCWAGAVYVFER